jgi:hypothetical protein
MESAAQQIRRYRFGAFEIDLLEGELRRQGLKVKLNEKPFKVLASSGTGWAPGDAGRSSSAAVGGRHLRRFRC